MSGTMTPDALVPGPDCARYATVLPALAQDAADADTLARARAHVAGCAYCAAQLAAYDALDAALARQHGDASGSPALDVAAIMRMTDMDEPHGALLDDTGEPPEEARPRHTRPLRRPSRRLADLAGIAAAILVVITVVALILSHTGFPRQAGPRKPTPTPNLVPTQQATVNPTTAPTTTVSFTSLHMVSPTTGWAVTSNGSVARTTDGWAHWAIVTPPDAQVHENNTSLNAISGSEAWVADAQSPCTRMWHTTDGGQSWTRSPVPPTRIQTAPSLMVCSAPTFVDAQHGWMMASLGFAAGSEGVAIFRTTDGGQTWSEISDGMAKDNSHGALPFSGDKSGIAFVNASTGWITGSSAAPAFWLYVTHDGGQTWSQQTPSLPAGAAAPGQPITYAPVFFSSMYGVLPVDFPSQASQTCFYVTRDGGQTWIPTQAVPSGQWSLADASHWWVATGNTLYRTSDAGQSWTRITPNAVFNNVTSFDMVSSSTGFAVVDVNSGTGSLISTTDGGQTWAKVTS